MRRLQRIALAALPLTLWMGGAGSRTLAQDDVRKEIEKEIEKAGKGLSEKIQGLISRQEERIGSLEKKLADKDREIAELKKKVDELTAKAKTSDQPKAETKPEAEKPKGHPLLGVEPAAVDDETRAKLNLREGQGTKIAAVQPGSPADKAGIKAGDIVLSLGGKEAGGPGLRDLVQTFAPGDKVEVVFLRGAEKINRTAELVDRDQFLSQIAPRKPEGEPSKTAPAPGKPAGPVVLGLLVGETDGGPEVQNVEPGKTGAVAQLKEGDIILAVNGKKMKTLDDLSEALAQAKVGEEMSIEYKRKDGEFRAKVVGAGERGEPKFVSVAPLKEKPAEGEKKSEVPPAGQKAPGTLGVQVLEDNGVKVVEVRPGGAAASAGIREGDVIVEVDKKPIKGIDDLKELLKGKSAGDAVAVTIVRGSERKAIEGVKLGAAGAKAPESAAPAKKPRGVMGITAIESDDRGLVVSVVTEKGPADKAGVHKDDILLKVNGIDVKGFDDLEKALKDARAGDKVKLTVKRGDETKEIEVELGIPETSSLFPPVRAALASSGDGAGAEPAYLGVALLESSSSTPRAGTARVAIHEVYEGGPAAAAGLHEGDELLSVNGDPVGSLEDIGRAVSRRSPGQTIKVRVSRAGETIEAGLMLGGGR